MYLLLQGSIPLSSSLSTKKFEDGRTCLYNGMWAPTYKPGFSQLLATSMSSVTCSRPDTYLIGLDPSPGGQCERNDRETCDPRVERQLIARDAEMHFHQFGMDVVLNAGTSISEIASILKQCVKNKCLEAGQLVHEHIKQHQLDQDRFLGNCLIEMYGNCGSTMHAGIVFSSLPSYNSYSWNIMINAYAKNGHGREALDLFQEMIKAGFDPDYCTFISALNACTCVSKLEDVQEVHSLIIEYGCLGDELESALIAVYGKCGCLIDAMVVFSQMHESNLVAWNSLLGACVQNGCNKEAVDIFGEMRYEQQPDVITLTLVLDACANMAALAEGTKLHVLAVANGLLGDTTLMTALLNMYGKSDSFDRATCTFHQISEKDVVCWNAFISSSNESEHWDMSVKLFYQMQAENFKPDHITFVYALDACANRVFLQEGQIIHASAVEGGYEKEVVVGTALVNMYGKCGALVDARDAFIEIPRQDVVSWSAVVNACAQNGCNQDALNYFEDVKVDGIQPDTTMYLSILTACNHGGWVNYSMFYFLSMTEEHGAQHTMEHYLCMVDILARAGHLAEAEQFIHAMPFLQNATVWSCLLGACRIHGDQAQAMRAAKQVLAMDSTFSSSYVMLTNVVYGEEV